MLTLEPITGSEHQDQQERCRHCGLASGRALFCCAGCEAIYKTLHSLGLEEFYSRAKVEFSRTPDFFHPSRLFAPKDYTLFDACSEDPPGRHTFRVQGIHCAGCLWLLEKLPQVHPGIIRSELNITTGKLETAYDAHLIKPSEIAALLSSLGYPPKMPDRTRTDPALGKRELLRLGMAGFLAMNLMMLSVSLFEGMSSGISLRYANLLRWTSLVLALPLVTFCASPIYRSSLSALRHGFFHIELPISLAIGGAFLLSIINTFLEREFVYYDSMGALIFLLLGSRIIQKRALQKAQNEADVGWNLLPSFVTRVKEGSREKITLGEIREGDRLLIKAGERLPADSVVEKGSSEYTKVILTGEFKTYPLHPGTEVLAGSLNITSDVEVNVLQTPDNSRLGQILRRLNQSGPKMSHLSRFLGWISRTYLKVILLVAAAIFVCWLPDGIDVAFQNVLSLFIVTCPCALALAAPTTIGLAIGRAARSGILVKNPEVFEDVTESKHVFFDKTGTLTNGEFSVVHAWGTLPEGYQRDFVALLQATPEHPISRSLFNEVSSSISPNLGQVSVFAGAGVAFVNANDQIFRIGSWSWFQSLRFVLNPELDEKLRAWEEEGCTLVLFSHGPTVQKAFALRDEIQKGSKELLKTLVDSGVSVSVLSGDAQGAVNKVASQLGIEFASAQGGLTPEQKGEIVRRADDAIFIGDGVNDLFALRNARVGISLAGGVETTLGNSDIVVTHGGIVSLREFFAEAKRVKRIILLSLFVSFTYNLAAAFAAALGQVTPLFAAVLMPLSSLTILLIAMSSHSLSGGKPWK